MKETKDDLIGKVLGINEEIAKELILIEKFKLIRINNNYIILPV